MQLQISSLYVRGSIWNTHICKWKWKKEKIKHERNEQSDILINFSYLNNFYYCKILINVDPNNEKQTLLQ